MFRSILALSLSIFLFAACDSADVEASLRYNVQVMDQSSTVATGEFDLDREPSSTETYSGSYTLAGSSGDPLPPLTSTTGTFDYSLTSGTVIRISISEMADSGIIFEADYNEDGFNGTWSTLTIAGPVEQGTFTATHIE